MELQDAPADALALEKAPAQEAGLTAQETCMTVPDFGAAGDRAGGLGRDEDVEGHVPGVHVPLRPVVFMKESGWGPSRMAMVAAPGPMEAPLKANSRTGRYTAKGHALGPAAEYVLASGKLESHTGRYDHREGREDFAVWKWQRGQPR